ncbi:DEAD/DEAH box helicase family protein [Lysinibacillus boronitolerans]|uniref:DEAD/DEAH box helicase family protein n=1 Tax=Lysinibacillus boronitolerans TaxID=309788 RepID=UPI003854D701
MKTEFVSMNELQEGKITTQLATKWINRKQHLLINSQTGTGKTTSLLNASLNLASPKSSEFFIFTGPTINLCEQVYKDHPKGTLLLTGKLKKKGELVKEHINNGNRVFITTYDQVPLLIMQLKRLNSAMIYNLIIDEYHRLVTDYNEKFRKQTMANLFAMQKNAKSLIALSGTPQLVLLEHFDARIDVERRNTKVFEELAYIPMPRDKPFFECLLEYIYERVNKGYKMLVFLQSVNKIQKLTEKLNSIEIQAININASTKGENAAYQNIINHSRLPREYDVIITTSLLSEGISINIEDGDKTEIMVISHSYSRFFSPFVIEQISNRIRQTYDRLSILTENPGEYENTNTEVYNYQKKYQHLKGIALEAQNKLKKSFRKSSMDALNLIAECEKNVHLVAHNNSIVIDELSISHNISQDLELYYLKNRQSFLHILRNHFASLEWVKFPWKTKKEQGDDKEVKIYRKPLTLRFTEEDFLFLKKNQRKFDFYICKLEITSTEKSMLKALIPYTSSYELLIKIVRSSSIIKVNQLIESIIGLVELKNLKLSKSLNFTTAYISNIENQVGTDFYSANELNEILNYAYKFTKSIFGNIIISEKKFTKKYFYKNEKRNNKMRFYSMQLHSIDTLATQFGLTPTEIKVMVNCAIAKSDFTNKNELKAQLLTP